MLRQDYAYPFRLDAASHQAAQARYEKHVEQLIRQVLLTSPGERINLPEFGCGLRQLLFAPHSEALDTTTKMIVSQSLDRWLAGQIRVLAVNVIGVADGPDPAQLLVQIDYLLIETQNNRRTEVRIL
jgi:uncharacterized protein